MKRLRDGVAALGTEWMVMLEADTLLENYFSVVPPADISGGSTEANVYSREVLQLMRQLSGVVPPCSYSSSGGTAIRSAPFAAMVDQFDTLLLPHLHARDDRVVRESDCTLTAMAVSSGTVHTHTHTCTCSLVLSRLASAVVLLPCLSVCTCRPVGGFLVGPCESTQPASLAVPHADCRDAAGGAAAVPPCASRGALLRRGLVPHTVQ